MCSRERERNVGKFTGRKVEAVREMQRDVQWLREKIRRFSVKGRRDGSRE